MNPLKAFIGFLALSSRAAAFLSGYSRSNAYRIAVSMRIPKIPLDSLKKVNADNLVNLNIPLENADKVLDRWNSTALNDTNIDDVLGGHAIETHGSNVTREQQLARVEDSKDPTTGNIVMNDNKIQRFESASNFLPGTEQTVLDKLVEKFLKRNKTIFNPVQFPGKGSWSVVRRITVDVDCGKDIGTLYTKEQIDNDLNIGLTQNGVILGKMLLLC